MSEQINNYEDIKSNEVDVVSTMTDEMALPETAPQANSLIAKIKQKARQIQAIDNWFNLSAFQKKKFVKKCCKIAVVCLLWLFGTISLYLCLSNLYQQAFNSADYTGFFNMGQAVVASNSMNRPSYTLNGETIETNNPIKQNDWIFYKGVDPSDVQVGDIVIYKKTDLEGETLIVHRLISKDGNGFVVTKGDNNSTPDAAFPESDIVGKYLFKIDGFGAILNLLSTPWLFAFIFITVSAFIIGKILLYYWHKKTIINAISTKSDNKVALDKFFDI